MTLIENRTEQSKNVFKKKTQVLLAIAELMNEKTSITVKKISQKTIISINSTRNYVQDLERSEELVIKRQGKDKKSEILDMWLTEEAISATYDRFLSCLPENGKERLFILLEKRINKDY